jgi:hypothetical protein
MNNNDKDNQLTDKDLPFIFFDAKEEAQQRIALFVTTKKAVAETGGMTGKWFILGDYANKYAFIESAKEFAAIAFDDVEPELIFTHYNADVNVQKFISDDDVDDQLWTILLMDTQTVEIINYWHDRYGLIDDNVRTTAHIGKQYFTGCFDDDTTQTCLQSKQLQQSVLEHTNKYGSTGVNDLRADRDDSALMVVSATNDLCAKYNDWAGMSEHEAYSTEC